MYPKYFNLKRLKILCTSKDQFDINFPHYLRHGYTQR